MRNELLSSALRLIDIVVPDDGCLIVLAESYFDESNTHGGKERLCVAGYIFKKEAAEQQATLWAELLAKWKLPYFHMIECAHNIEKFAHLKKDECDLAARDAIKIIKETASMGVGITVLESDYLEIMPKVEFYGSAYDACARDVISGVAHWIEANEFEGVMHYFFEDGTNTENNASFSILRMMKDAETRLEARYGGHTFIPKVRSPGVQAADIFAWHAGQDCKRALRGDPIRKDFESLCEIPHRMFHMTRERLQERAAIISAELKSANLTAESADKIWQEAKGRN